VQHQPEIWQRFMQAFFAADVAVARSAFDEAVSAWKVASNG
jgi:hypothetical protein